VRGLETSDHRNARATEALSFMPQRRCQQVRLLAQTPGPMSCCSRHPAAQQIRQPGTILCN
jgi:hypothetical protein